jgi:hypothetical protein
MSTLDIYDVQYKQPAKKDMAICFVYFNSMKSKRLLMNYFYTIEKLKHAKIPYYTLELCLHANHEIADAIHYKSTHAMFHKEQLCHILEKHVSWWYSKVLFLDADILFEDPNWYTNVSNKLNLFQVVHPFESCKWLDLSYKNTVCERRSVVTQKNEKKYDSTYHPGFAWAFQRRWFHKNGFFRYAITGSGDTLSAAAWLNQDLGTYNVQEALRPAYNDYIKKIERPLIDYIPGTVWHLYHGERKNRKYVDRHKILEGTDIRNDLKKSFWGIFSFKKPECRMHQKLKKYFIERSDDCINEFQDIVLYDEAPETVTINY